MVTDTLYFSPVHYVGLTLFSSSLQNYFSQIFSQPFENLLLDVRVTLPSGSQGVTVNGQGHFSYCKDLRMLQLFNPLVIREAKCSKHMGKSYCFLKRCHK